MESCQQAPEDFKSTVVYIRLQIVFRKSNYQWEHKNYPYTNESNKHKYFEIFPA